MNQLAIPFDPKDKPHCMYPPVKSQCEALLNAFYRGERLTVLTAIEKYGVYALSQRCGDLKNRYSWPVLSQTIKTSTGKYISEYWMEFEHATAR